MKEMGKVRGKEGGERKEGRETWRKEGGRKEGRERRKEEVVFSRAA